MANFHTHFTAGVSAGMITATYLKATHNIDLLHIMPIIMLSTLGGILPDVDSDHSDSIKIIFNLSAISCSVLLTLWLAPLLKIIYSFIVFTALFLLFRFGMIIPFRHFTHHRGIFHTIPMGVLFGLSVCISSYYLLHNTLELSWIYGSTLFIGFITHLIFDELYSVNLAGARLKKSFGSAFKFYCRKNIKGSLLLYIFMISLWYIMPQPHISWRNLKCEYSQNLWPS